ncbi:hypothetical protein RB653_005433 [Dictyostelium firmibasis]|uniref:INTS8 TPR repeats domain-containing protein n=1 Tax=Dictyostelium firmibasis TaxID=79012 RepID=A0AAN7YY46_9MYCE
MKGDRMPTILSPLANAMGDEYTDTWFDFLLDPIKLVNHLQELSIGKSNHPNVSSIIKTLLKQYEKYTAQQQQHQTELQQSSANTTPSSTPPSQSTTTSTQATGLSSSSGGTSTNNTLTTSKRSKLIIDLVISVITNLKFSLDDFEKNIPIKHQRNILEQLESKTDVDIEYQTFLNRWTLRGIIKGTPIKYLLSNYSSSPSSPNLISSNQQQQQQSNITNAPMTPPMTPPPTPPSFISLSSNVSPTSSANGNTIGNKDIIDTTTSLEELFYKSNLFLNEWISDNYDSDKPSDVDKVVPIILFELGEFQFYKENFYDAQKLFDRANEIINSPHILDVIEKSEEQYKQSSFIKGIVGNKLQQLSNYKEKIKCLIIACKTIDLYDIEKQEYMDISTTITTSSTPQYENNKNFQIEKALASNDLTKTIDILNSDITDFNASTSLDIEFRLNLESNKILSSKQQTVYFSNLLKLTLIQYNYKTYYLDDFKKLNKESIQIFFSMVEMVIKILNSDRLIESIHFLLFKIYNILYNDNKLNCNTTRSNRRIFIQTLASKFPTLFKKIKYNTDNVITDEPSNDMSLEGVNGDIEIESDFNKHVNNKLTFGKFIIEDNDTEKIHLLVESFKKDYSLTEQQYQSIYYQKAMDLFGIGNLKASSTILIDYLGGNDGSGDYIKPSSNSVDYQLFLYGIILKNYKKPQQITATTTTANTNGKAKTNSIVTESFKLLLEKHGPPSEFIAERMFSILIDRSKWETVKSISNLLKSFNESSYSDVSPTFCELVYIVEFLASIGKQMDNENKEKKSTTTQNPTPMAVDDDLNNNESSHVNIKIENETDNKTKTENINCDDNTEDNTTNTDNKNNSNNNNNSIMNGSDRDDSDMDIDDDDIQKYAKPIPTTPTSSQSSSNKTKISSKSEELFIGFISSILPTYDRKSYHWTFFKSNTFYSKNSGEISGILNLLEKKSLFNRVIFIFVGLIHSIQTHKKVQNDLNLDLYNEISNQVSNTITFPNKHFSIEIESLINSVYLDTLNRMNKIFGIKIDSQQKKRQQSNKNLTVFNNGRYLIYIGDIHFDKKFHREALRYYLLGCGLENAFFSDPAKTSVTNSKYLTFLSRRIFDCFYFLRAPMQAIVVSQFFGNLNQTCLVSFKIIQEEYYQLDTNYFQYIWELPLLEVLLTTFTKQKDLKKMYLINQIISNPIINENNHPDIRKNFIKNTKHNFWKAVSSNYLLQ